MANKRTFDPYLELQDELLGQIHHALQGGIILQINNWCMGDLDDRIERTQQIASGSRIDKNFMGDVYKLCLEVKKTLEFDDDVEFYLTQNPVANATAYLSMIEGKPHIINIYSGLYNLLDEDEFKTIVGHEIGHLINKDRWVSEIIDFVYPDMDKCPLYLKRRVDLYNLLAELSADRYGYLASKNLEASISASYKLSTGVNIWKHDVDLPGMLKNNDEQLKTLLGEGIATHTTHPFEPIRIKALEVFANAKSEEELEKQMQPLIDLLMEAGCSDEDRYMMDFITTAGMMMAMADGEATLAEHNAIIEKLGEITLTPESYFAKVASGNIQEIHDKAIKKLISLDKETEMIRFLAEISLSDGRIDEEEVVELLRFGDELNCPKEIVARIIGSVIREQYRPLAINMSESEEQDEDSKQEELVEESPKEIIEAKPKFVMTVNDKTVDKAHRLMLCGKVDGIVDRKDKVIITNGDKTFEDEILGIKVRYSILDSTKGIDPKEEVELCMTTTSLRDIDGRIKDWKVIALGTVEDTTGKKVRSKSNPKSSQVPEKLEPEDDKEDDEPYTLTIPVPRYDLLQIAKGYGTEYTIHIYPEDEDVLIEYDEVEEDGETFLVAKTDDEDMFIPKKYDRLNFYSGKSPEGAHVIVEVTGQRVEKATDENGYPITYEEDGETCLLENVIFSLGTVLEKNINPGKRTEAYEGPFLKCLATMQPWAQLIVTGIKDIECKESLPTKPRKVFIAASGSKLKWDELHPMVQEIYTKYEKKGVLPAYDDLPTKCIVGYVDIVKASFDPVESIWGRDHDGMKYTLRNAMELDEPIYGKNKATPYFYNVEGYDEEHLPAAHKADLSE